MNESLYTGGDHTEGRRPLALPAYIRLGRNSLFWTNTLAYFEKQYFSQKDFTILFLGPILQNILRLYFTSFRNKLECFSLASLSALSNV